MVMTSPPKSAWLYTEVSLALHRDWLTSTGRKPGWASSIWLPVRPPWRVNGQVFPTPNDAAESKVCVSRPVSAFRFSSLQCRAVPSFGVVRPLSLAAISGQCCQRQRGPKQHPLSQICDTCSPTRIRRIKVLLSHIRCQ